MKHKQAAAAFFTFFSFCALMVGESIVVGKQAHARNFQRCWSDPPAKSLTEMANIVTRVKSTRKANGSVLMLSNGDIRDLKTAYGAGLLLGWERTGRRPNFSGVTSVGVSNLIAPFAFIGVQGDPMIADIYNCNADTPEQMASRAAHNLTLDVMAMIAQKYREGGKLLVALPGSPGRHETVWDLGKIAASDHPDALENIRTILKASVHPLTSVDTKRVVAGAGKTVARNMAFRKTGAGAAFLLLTDAGFEIRRLFLIENGVRYPSHSMAFARRQLAKPQPDRKAGLITALGIARKISASSSMQLSGYASIRYELKFQRSKPFDISYVRQLFDFAFRQARMGSEWKTSIPYLPKPYGAPHE